MDYTDFYVYAHHRADTGEIFYIGKGRNSRYCQSARRTVEWKRIVKSYGYFTTILKSNLTNAEALECEYELISRTQGLVNIVATLPKSVIIPESIREWVGYSTTSPTGLVWLKTARKAKSGEPCGVLRSGRYSFTLDNQRLAVSRVVWFLHYGILRRDFVIDHIDGNPLNNSIENLREVSHKTNANNSIKQREGDIELGVFRYSTTDRNGNKTFHYYGTFRDNLGHDQRKSFAIKKYGDLEAKQLAIKFRQEGLELCYQQFQV